MRRKSLSGWIAVGMLVLSPAFAADEPDEQVTTAKLAPATPYRLYVSDFAFQHVVDGRPYVIDGVSHPGSAEARQRSGFRGANGGALSPVLPAPVEAAGSLSGIPGARRACGSER